MSSSRWLRTFAFTAALSVLAGCPCAPAAPGVPDSGRLLGIVASCAEVEGDVQVRRAGEVYWEPAQVGTTLRGGDWVRTAPGSRCVVALVGGASVDLAEGTVAEIGQLGEPGHARALVALESGAVQARSGAEGAQPLAFRTPDGRLLHVEARAAGGQQAIVDVTVAFGALHVVARRGSARVSLDDGPVWVTPEGSAAEIGLSGPILAPLPPFPESRGPEVDAHLACGSGQEIALTWEKVGQAREYRVQVAKDLSFRQLLFNKVVEPAAFGFNPPASVEALAWRVASVDDRGRTGDFGFARRIFCEAAVRQDYLVGPEPGAVFLAGRKKAAVRLTWRPVDAESRYRVAVARGPDLSGAEAAVATTGECALEVELEPGTYYWGVYLVGEGLAPLFAAPRKLSVVPGAPRLKVPSAVNDWGP